MLKLLGMFVFLFLAHADGRELRTNALSMDAPDWITIHRLDGIVEHIQSVLEWDIRRIQVYWYKDQNKFEGLHHYGPTVLAISRKADNTVHLGPRVNNDNFDAVFGHELVHVISFQKYKGAIPPWLEEGLANHLSHQAKVDYHWLAGQPFPEDVRHLTHPFGGTVDNIRYHYMASQALAEMISSKCDFSNLLRLSVKRNMDNYLDTYCNIKDLTGDFKKWVKAHGA